MSIAGGLAQLCASSSIGASRENTPIIEMYQRVRGGSRLKPELSSAAPTNCQGLSSPKRSTSSSAAR
ncbi:hypothetical protein BBFGKLBO_01577 [Synechococcus sp. CBW1107]|jgi:hypothetical protein|nr:hypothetical protein BBFGKLBO_01577 [Synechococcus sp. CBW1107]